MPIFLLIYFILELYLLVAIGSAMGPLLTVLWVIGGFVVGMLIMIQQGRSSLESLQRDLNARGVNLAHMNQEMLGRFLNLMAGLLILLPGFMTDFFGIVLLIASPVKRWLGQTWQARQVKSSAFHKGEDVVEAEFYEVKTDKKNEKNEKKFLP
jgi:UPF0716 protein FxsA